MLPVPENRSRIRIPERSYRFSNILNKASFARSVVGLAENFLFGWKTLPLYFPPMIRMIQNKEQNRCKGSLKILLL